VLSLDIGLPVVRIAAPRRAVLGGGSEREQALLEAVDRRGRTIECAITILPLTAPASVDGHAVRGAIVLMEDGRVESLGPR
jgi:two-component system CheB/CheR fusion protein